MKPAPFEYHSPSAVPEVLALLGQHGDEAKPLAGGQSLVPMLALRLARFEHLVDLNRVAELASVEADDASVTVGAMTRQQHLMSDSVVSDRVPLLARATRFIGHFQIRNRGTLGGSVAHADPASEYPAVCVALDARMAVVGPAGQREVPASEFFVSTWTTSLGPGELLSEVRFPTWTGRCGFAVREVARRLGDFALAGVVCGVALDPAGRVARAAIGLFGMGSTPLRATAAERALTGSAGLGQADLAEIGQMAVAGLDPPDDVHASSWYRLRAGAELVTRALGAAAQEAAGA